MTIGMECRLTLVERDAAVGSEHTRPFGGHVLVQGAEESSEQLLERAEGMAHVVRASGYRIQSIRLILGVEDAARHAARVDLACRLAHLLADHSTLHLVATEVPGPHINWFELVGRLLGDPRWPLHVRLAFHDHVAPYGAASLRPLPREAQLAPESVAG